MPAKSSGSRPAPVPAKLVTLVALFVCGRPAVLHAQIDAPFVPTPPGVVEAMLDLAGVTAADSVLDLGSGDGRIVFAAAARGARGVGIELRGDLVEGARAEAADRGLGDRARFVEGDVLEVELPGASVVTIYLVPTLMKLLRPRLLDAFPPGTRIVSHAFRFPDWEPDASVEVPRGDGRATHVHLWIVPGSR